MPRTAAVIAAVAVLALCAGLALAAQAKAPQEPAPITVPQDAKLRMPQVSFAHAPHQQAGVECTTCHHTWDPSAEVQSCASAGCHDLANPQNTEERRGPSYFRNAFHGTAEHSCNGCHRARDKAGEPAGPTQCDGCHAAS